MTSLIGHTHELLGIIRGSDKPADSLIDTFYRSRKYLGSHDRGFITKVTYATLRNWRRCEYHLDQSLDSVQDELLPSDRLMLVLVTSLILFPASQTLTVKILEPLVKSLRLKELLPQLFENLQKPEQFPSASLKERLAVQYSFPDWMIEQFISLYGDEEAEKLCASMNEPAPLTIRVNTLKTDVETCQKEMAKQEIETAPVQYSPFGLNVTRRVNMFSLNAFRDGLFEVQDEGSQLLPLFIDPKPNAKVLDACAGAGGKTLELAALMKNRGEIFASDINKFRLEELKKRTKRAGVQNVRILPVDSIDELHETYSGFFDIVLVDAPCSGLGTIRRNPGMKWMVTKEMIDEIAEKQKMILRSAAPLVKPGGRLVYATCTILNQENENQIKSFLETNQDYCLLDASSIVGKWNFITMASNRFIKLLPHRHHTDGFFCAMMEKISAR
ncbi:MAG TPA: methyltransferase domain-containing protein [Bacteroidota bacterium]|nr:methyltransferase domain-containing protein [Bacteroidota bacterium]